MMLGAWRFKESLLVSYMNIESLQKRDRYKQTMFKGWAVNHISQTESAMNTLFSRSNRSAYCLIANMCCTSKEKHGCRLAAPMKKGNLIRSRHYLYIQPAPCWWFPRNRRIQHQSSWAVYGVAWLNTNNIIQRTINQSHMFNVSSVSVSITSYSSCSSSHREEHASNHYYMDVSTRGIAYLVLSEAPDRSDL